MGSLYIISAILLWSSLGILVRLSDAPVHIIMFYTSVISVFILGIPSIFKNYRAGVFKKKLSPYVLFLGPLSLINTFSFFYAFKNTTIANAVFTHYIAPVVVAFLAPIFLKERLTIRIIISIIIASIGLWILIGIKPSELLGFFQKTDANSVGIMSGLFSGLAYAIIIMVARVYASHYHPIALVIVQNSVISLLLLPLVRDFPLSSLWIIIFMGIVHSSIAPILYFKGMGRVSASKAAVLGYIEPLGAIIFGMIFLGEYPSIFSAIGGALVIIAGYLTMSSDKEDKKDVILKR